MKFYRTLAIVGIISWVLESWFFGWNKTPINVYEQFADLVTQIAVFWGIVGDLLSNIEIKKVNVTNINAKAVEIIKPNKITHKYK